MKLSTALFVIPVCIFGFGAPREPVMANAADGAASRWLAKPVLESRVLDDMESLNTWQAFTVGADEIVDARKTSIVQPVANVADISLTTTHIRSGNYSLLMRTPTRLPGVAPKNGRSWGRSGIRRVFNGDDWSAFNRLSFWIYPDLPGFYTTALDIHLFNNGVKKIPALFGQEGETSLVLRNHEWNHIVWEIANVARDKITGMEISYGLSGSAPEEADSIRFCFDKLDLERVDPDKTEGWDVWPDRISYSHDGYQTGGLKTAIASGIDAKVFRVVNVETGETVLSKPIRDTVTSIGRFQWMDFSELREPGKYELHAGNSVTHAFPIEGEIWEASIWKALNFFYMERCGAAIPGVHGVCHRDWSCTHNNQRIMINGGWHDAGDLSQGLGNTAEIDYGIFSLAERLRSQQGNTALYDRLIEEGKWGLDWILKTSFGDGFRNTWSISSRRTNDILGDDDDINTVGRNSPMDNFMAAAAEAIAARVLQESDPRLAALSQKMAIADWKFGMEGMKTAQPSAEIWTGTFDSDNIGFETASEAILAAVDIYKLTGDRTFEQQAVSLTPFILDAQQRTMTAWDIPCAGFFYTNTSKNRILHFVHRGRDQAHIFALTELCKTFPEHPDYMKWYSAVALYAEYLKTAAAYTAPYNVMPASIYVDTEYIHVPESRKASFKAQVLNGVPLGQGHYFRRFPVWMDYRGHFGTILPQAQALASAAHLRGDLDAAQLANHQLEWIIGRNPFSQSTMYGEGYDFVPLYSPSSGDMAGALPVGIQSREENDAPYWPVQSTWTYKEVWVHPVARWIWLMKDLSGAADVQGQADGPVLFREKNTGKEITLHPDRETGLFRSRLPEGRYTMVYPGGEQQQTLLPTQSYHFDLRANHALTMEISTEQRKDDLHIIVHLRGVGAHHLRLRTSNLAEGDLSADVQLKAGRTGLVEWHSRLLHKGERWIALVIPDDVPDQKLEINGMP